MKTSKKQGQLYQLTNKNKTLYDYTLGILNRTLSMFEYQNLPETIPQYALEKQLQMNGYSVIFKAGQNLYCTVAGLAGQEQSPYGEPTTAIINVPALNFNQTLTINQDCVLIKNDDLRVGLMPTITKHGTQQLENEITMLLTDYNARIQTLISAGTDQTIQDARNYINQIIDGNLSVVGENSFYQDLKTHNPSQNAKENYQDLIAYQQYIKSDLYNEIGLTSLNNMKKERLITSEVDSGSDQIFPYIDNMLRNRKTGIDMVNKLFNGKVAVDFGSTWKDKAEQRNTPDQTGQPVQPVQPVQQVQPQPVQPVKQVKQVEQQPVQNVQQVQTTKQTTPVQPAKPVPSKKEAN